MCLSPIALLVPPLIVPCYCCTIAVLLPQPLRVMADPTSLHREGAADRQNPTRTPARKPALLHEPFVSPEFGASAGLKRRPSRLNNGVVDGNDRGARALANLHGTGNTRPQAAPLYTVSAAGAEDTGGGLVAPLSVLSNSLLPGKRLAVTDAGCLSVASASATPLSPVAGMDGVHYNLKPDEVPPPQASRNQVEAKGALKPPLNSPRDLSPLVIEAACTWGQALGTILGQDVLHSGKAKPRTEMLPLAVRPTLTTTGLFPQIMTLRYGSLMCCEYLLTAA